MDNRGLANRMLGHSLRHINGLSASEVSTLTDRLEFYSNRAARTAQAIVKVARKHRYGEAARLELLTWAAAKAGESDALASAQGALAVLLASAIVRDAELYRELNAVIGSEDFQRQVSSAMFEREFGAN